jgi:hypothetical protein
MISASLAAWSVPRRGRDRRAIQEPEPAEQIVCFLAARARRRSRDSQRRDDQQLAAGIIFPDEANDVRVSAGHGLHQF